MAIFDERVVTFRACRAIFINFCNNLRLGILEKFYDIRIGNFAFTVLSHTEEFNNFAFVCQVFNVLSHTVLAIPVGRGTLMAVLVNRAIYNYLCLITN